MTVKFEPFVGAQEAAAILGVEVPRISRYMKMKPPRMPPTIADLAASPIWRVEDIEILRDEKKWRAKSTRAQHTPKKQPYCGIAEAAALLGVDKSQISRWRREGRFPAPLLDKRPPGVAWGPDAPGLASTPVWHKQALLDFQRDRADSKANVA